MQNLIIKNEIILILLALFILSYIIRILFSSVKNSQKEFLYNSWEFIFNCLWLAVSIFLVISYLAIDPVWLTLIILILMFSSVLIFYRLYLYRGDKANYQDANLAQILLSLSYKFILINLFGIFFFLAFIFLLIYSAIGYLMIVIKKIGEERRWYDYLIIYAFSFALVNLLNLETYVLNLALPLILGFLIIIIANLISDNIKAHLKKYWQRLLSAFNMLIEKILN
jgi:hypothetical protein